MRHISFRQTDITGGFWRKKQEMNRKITIHAVHDRFQDTGRFEAFECNWKEGMSNRPHFFWDSDVAKWIEGVAYLLEKAPEPALESEVDRVVDLIEQNQDETGYFNIYFTVCEPQNRFTRRTDHELYCAGHLMEAAVAYYLATGKDKFLKLMCRYADYIDKVFRQENSAGFVTPGHEEIELALVKLYRCTGEKKYLELSKFFVDQRGKNKKDHFYNYVKPSYDQSHLPVRQQKTAEGHSVRACYLYAGMVDLAREYQDQELFEACRALFQNIINKRMYLTGGIGQSHVGEAFTIDYDLPNQHAYAETCAAISLAFFAQRMLELELDSVYADIVERAFYNGMLSGISLDGKSFFYENPLEIATELRQKDASIKEGHRTRFPITQRVEVFDCSCCPPNLNRVLASLGDYIYSEENDTYYIHQYVTSQMRENGVVIQQTSGFPSNGTVTIEAEGVKRLAVRIPGWCTEYKINAPYYLKNGYAYLESIPEKLEIVFQMTPVLIQATSLVSEDVGKAALQMGPVVYCLEGVDNGEAIAQLWVSSQLNAQIIFEEAFGTNAILTDGYRLPPKDALYSPLEQGMEKKRLKWIPYYAFANRGESNMAVWVKAYFE